MYKAIKFMICLRVVVYKPVWLIFRFTDTGWEAADGMEMTNIYKSLPHADVHRYMA